MASFGLIPLKIVKRIPLNSTLAAICLYVAEIGAVVDGFETKLGVMISCFSSIKSLLTEFIVISIGDLKLKIYTCCYSVLTIYLWQIARNN
ncbi:hypothetical protein DN438_09830 [Lactobacillus reuteri]|nr:hypothetical protein [Limosilactobacillus reuteri]MQB79636.1 hypothetical protein [Limosilactobacillus reuteri]